MKKTFYILLFFTIISCGSKIKIKDYDPNLYFKKVNEPDSIFTLKPKRVGTYSKEFKYPYIHINGFKSYDFTKSKIIKDKDSVFVNKVNFYRTYSSFYTRKSMYENFGNWDKTVFIRGERPLLIWEKVKLFPEMDKYFYVVTDGFECTTCTNYKSIYASVMVLDENRKDCFNDENPALKRKLIQLFATQIKNLTNSKQFYGKFYGLISKKKINNK